MTIIDSSSTTKSDKYNNSKIIQFLCNQIENRDFVFDQRLPSERELATMFKVSRNTIRRSLKALNNLGYVTTKKNSGTYVSYAPISYKSSKVLEQVNPIDLIDARTAMEPHICRLATLNARKDDIDKLEALLAIMENSVDNQTKFSETDLMFHTQLAKSTGNILIVWFIEEVNVARQQKQWTHIRKETLSKKMIVQYNKQHRKIIEAIKKRQSEPAADAMRNHLSHARNSLVLKLIE